MKRIVLVSFSMLAGFALAVPLLGLLSGAGAGGAPPLAVRNGDTNGDGDINISDAVYLLIYLFRNGAPPAALADSPELLERLRVLEERVDRLEPLGEQLESTREDVALLTERLDAHSDFIVLMANAKGRYSLPDDPESPDAYPMHFVADNDAGDGQIGISGATLDNEKIRFRTKRRGHLLIRLRGGHDPPSIALAAGLCLDGVGVSAAFSQDQSLAGFHPSVLKEFVARGVPPGDHELVLKTHVSPTYVDTEEKLATFLEQQRFEKCTLTVQFAPASAE